jgi:hypothetical protein
MILSPATFPKYWFVDDGGMLCAHANDNNDQMYQNRWNRVGAMSFTWPMLATLSDTNDETVAEGNGNAPGSRNGAFGAITMADAGPAPFLPTAGEAGLTSADAWGCWPFAFEEGVVGPDVFPKPKPAASAVATNYLFNEVGIDKSGQGTLDVQGPYRPRSIDPGAPAHWAYRVMNTKSGSVVGETTEGGYIFQRKSWVAYPWAPQADVGEVPPNAANGSANRIQGDISWGASGYILEQRSVENQVAATGTNDPRGACRLVYDGIDSFWGIAWRDGDGGGGSHTMWRWRANTPENVYRGVNNVNMGPLGETGDDAQTDFRFVDQSGNMIGFSNNFPYAMTTDGAGLVFYGHRDADNTAANNPVFRIDNTQPGRWKQRPSGSADGVDADRFVVAAADEVHDMFPFVGGDVGKRLRIVDGPNAGLYDVAVVADSNNVDLFDAGTVNPAVLAADTETTWHWVTVEKLTNHLVGQLSHLAYDQANGRLWAMGALGLQVSVDDGATWSALVSEAGGSLPQFPDADPRTGVQVGDNNGYTQSSFAIDANGDFYWISAGGEFWVNKLSWNTTGPGGDATFSRLGLTTNFPGANKPIGIDQLVFDVGTDNANGLGAIWVHADGDYVTSTESFYRLTVNAGALNAVDLTEYDPNVLKVNRHPRWIMCTPGGMSALALNNGLPRFVHNTRGQGSGVGLDVNFNDLGNTSNPIFNNNGSDAGFYASAFRPDGTFVNTCGNDTYGVFGSFWDNYFWDENNSIWVPWEGTAAEFDAFYGTTNGGAKVPHLAFEELLDNVQVNFTPAGGGTADVDEFKEGESFGFLATFGPHRTNVEDFSVTGYASRMGGEYSIESEAIKVASPNTRPVGVYWYLTPGNVVPGTFRNITGDAALVDANGKLVGWEPQRHAWLSGQGDNPDTITAGNNNSDFIASIDLGAAPPEIGKLRLMVSPTNTNSDGNYITASDALTKSMWFGASDDATFADGVFGGSAEYNAPNARWDTAAENFPNGWNFLTSAQTTSWPASLQRGHVIEIDLVKLGMTAGERTHRYWQIQYDSASGNTQGRIYWMEALDPAGNRIGMDANMRVDEADTDPEFAGVFIDEAVWIQDEPGGGGGATTISTGADPSGFVDTVTPDAGSFDVANIDITTDYLAWEEPNNPGPGFLRDPGNTPGSDLIRAKFGSTNDIDDRPSRQAMSKITAAAAGSITVRDQIIPENLAGVQWEVRRPFYNSSAVDYSGRPNQGPCNVAQATNPNAMGYDPMQGYFNHQEANETAGRRFRVTRKGVYRLR